MTQDEIIAIALEALETCVCAMQDYQAGIGITEMFDRGERMGRETIIAIREALAKEAVIAADRAKNNLCDSANAEEKNK